MLRCQRQDRRFPCASYGAKTAEERKQSGAIRVIAGPETRAGIFLDHFSEGACGALLKWLQVAAADDCGGQAVTSSSSLSRIPRRARMEFGIWWKRYRSSPRGAVL